MGNSIFDFDGAQLRVELDDDGAPWFVASDVCAALGHSNARKAVADHCDEDDVTTRYAIDATGRKQKVNHVNESGLYALIFGSRLEAAKRFKRWVTSEVLPAIRKTGAFPGLAQAVVPPILQADYRPWQKTWQDDIARLLCELNGDTFTGRQPRWVGNHYREIYECLLGEDTYKELKRRNPNPAKGSCHHSLIADHLIERFRAQLSVVEALLRCSDSLADFRTNLRRNFKGAPLQLPLMVRTRSLPRSES